MKRLQFCAAALIAELISCFKPSSRIMYSNDSVPCVAPSNLIEF